MTSPAGNPNQPASYDMHMLFQPPGNPTPNPGAPQSRNPPFPTPPPPGGPFSYPPQSAPFHHLHHQAFLYPRPSMPYPSPPMPPNVPNHGAHLMALLGGTQPPILESAVSMPPSSTLQSGGPSGEYSGVPPYPAASAPILPTAPSAPAAMLVASPQLGPSRVPSSKQPKGRRLSTGERAVYDVDVRLPGEPQPPQLEVTPITKYGSDPGLVLGRQIAVNRTYICYGLKLGAIRVLNINTALRSLLKGHGQRVSDMAFFADDVHLLASASVDGRIFVWKIDEGPDESDKPQITEKIVIAIQIMTKENSIHPHVCWHCHKQEVLVVGIGNSVLRIDTNKVGKGESFFAEEPLKCHLDKLIDGVQLVGKHDGEVTDLSMSQWMTTRLVSASKDGTIKIWEDRKATPLVIIRPHDGQPVNSVSFLAAPHRPDHIVLITAGPLNREVKVWVSASQEGWLLPSDSESWQCTQTLDLRSSSEARVDDAFFNQVVVLPQASLILLANAKKNAIYAVHVDYGPYPVLTRMDYIAEFMVTMPILSLTGTTDCLPDGEQVVQVYCVQTQAIQQYALDLSQCLPPPLENVGLERDPSISHVIETRMSDGFAVSESSRGSSPNEITTGGSFPNLQSHIGSSGGGTSTTAARASMLPGNADAQGILEPDTMTKEKHAPPVDDNTVPVSSQPGSSADAPGRLQAFVSPSKGAEQGASDDDHISNQVVTNQSVERTEEALANFSDIVSVNASSTTQESKAGSDDSALAHNFHLLKMNNNITHLITPSEILSGAITSSESTPIIQEQKGREIMDQCVVNHDMESVDLDVKGVGENGPMSLSVDNEKSSTECSVSKIEMTNEYSTLKTEILTEKKSQPVDTRCSEAMEDSLIASGESCQEVPEILKEDSEKTSDTAITELQSPAAKGKKQKATQSQASEPSSSSASPFNSSDSLNEQGNGSSVPFTDASASHIAALQQSVTQLIALQKEMQKQMLVSVAVPVTKEGRRIETSLGRSMEKAVKANVDSLWARMQEDNAKREKLEKDCVQQITTLLTNAMSKDLPAVFEKALKKEFSAVGPAVARAVTPVIEKTVSSAVTECFQRGVGDKAVNQLEKSVNSKLEVTVAKQIQAQFQTSGKQALQEALRSSLESSVIPAFEQSCKLMFEQVDSTFQKGMTEHTSAAQRQFESTHTPLALTLRDAINSASSITQNLTTELVEGQRKVLAVLTSGNRTSLSSGAMQQGSDPLGGVPVIEAPIDPKKELSRLISDQKFEESFTLALQRSDVSIVSWLCSQVDLLGICSTTPLPLSQGVLLALLQQLACDLVNETPQKLRWMTDVAAVVNPADQTIAVHVRPIFEQVYQILAHQRSLPTIPPNEATSIRLLMHVINSVLMSCK